ncbi:phage/plasmid replication domain-containing protein [Cecembia rubra]|uniref:Replication-associated protein G2P N-terminal domain-containing protein n=1 Tax=Cecembia rubra TaxID=1485585 RepID=A0A2P8DXI1_9BACT|nr:phage/plasmid replication protein [Cecembia rubra]PSL01920.1 hypothetical protein CLV48_1118 [Cecembia rubra]
MYDTVHLWIPKDQVCGIDLDRVSNHLKSFTEHQKNDGERYKSGQLGNSFKVYISEQGISLKGSLAKFLLSDNFQTLKRSESKTAFEKLGDELGLLVNRAKVSRIDFAHNFEMKYRPEIYYPYLGDCQYFKRIAQPNSVYWTNKNRTKLVYNKVLEAKTKGERISGDWKQKNVLRYEMRYTKRLCENLRQPEIFASTLSDERFYKRMVIHWIQEYNSIHKLNEINLNFDAMNSPKDFIKQLALMKIKEIGQQKVLEMVEEMREKGTFDKPEYYSRLKKEIREICKMPEQTKSTELILELDEKVRQVISSPYG